MIDPGAHEVAFSDRFSHHFLERSICCRRNGRRKRSAQRGFRSPRRVEQDSKAHLGKKLGWGCLIEHVEAGRDIAFEGKLMEQSRTEGVEGLDLEPTRGVQRE